MISSAKTPKEYLLSLPDDRYEAIKKVYDVIRRNVPDGYEEVMNWGMICWQVPLSLYPDTYNKQPLMYAGLASQKNYMALYLMVAYGSPELRAQFVADYTATGKKLDMGGACIRFKKLEDLPLEMIGEFVSLVPINTYILRAKQVHGDRIAKKSAH